MLSVGRMRARSQCSTPAHNHCVNIATKKYKTNSCWQMHKRNISLFSFYSLYIRRFSSYIHIYIYDAIGTVKYCIYTEYAVVVE